MRRTLLMLVLVVGMVFTGFAVTNQNNEADAHIITTAHWHNWPGSWTQSWQVNCGQYSYPNYGNCYWYQRFCSQISPTQWVWAMWIDFYKLPENTYYMSYIAREPWTINCPH